MSSLITVEDYNSVLINYPNSFDYIIDFSKFPNAEHFKYDFVEVNIGFSNNQYTYVLSFKNDVWTRQYSYETNENINITTAINSGTYVFTVTSSVMIEDLKIILNMFPFNDNAGAIKYYDGNAKLITIPQFEGVSTYSFIVYESVLRYYALNLGSLSILSYNKESLGDGYYKLLFMGVSIRSTGKITLQVYSNLNRTNNIANFYFYYPPIKNSNWIWIDEEELYLGLNTIHITPFSQSKFELKYENQILNFNGGGTFEGVLNLNDKNNLNPAKIEVFMEGVKYTDNERLEYSLPVTYRPISSYQEFKSNLGNDYGDRIIQIINDISSPNVDDIFINHNVEIIGNGNLLDLNQSSIIIGENVTVKINNLNFINGNPCFIQKEGSNLELSDCNFEDCGAEDYYGLGSIIHCDVDIDSLNIQNDFTTKMLNVNIINSYSAIFHGGEFIMDKCKFLLNNAEIVNNKNPAFLYQTDGECSIRHSLFDIDFDGVDYFCDNNQSLGLGQCVILCGENAIINNSTSKDIAENNLNFFDNPYYNTSHIFAKYYYPQIEKCVYVSPTLNRENKAICYSISGVDWIFKNNVQITRVEWDNENRYNPFEW